jgi:peptide/nickel transport system permease protein
VRTAKSKGLSSSDILKYHLLPNALIPLLTILGVILLNTLGGSIVVETAFNLPGVGQLLAGAIAANDLPLVQGISFYIAAIVVFGYLLLDAIYLLIDPRLRS